MQEYNNEIIRGFLRQGVCNLQSIWGMKLQPEINVVFYLKDEMRLE